MNRLLYLLLLATLPLAAQGRKALMGRVMWGNDAVANVYVINKKTGTETKTDAKGNFTLDAKAGDVLTVYSNKTEVRDFKINDFAFKDNPYVLSVKVIAYELDEVVINEQTVTSESLGLVPKNQKRYTPAERRLKTASEFKPSFMVGYMPGIVIPTDAIINAISGRTKMLKKAFNYAQHEEITPWLGKDTAAHYQFYPFHNFGHYEIARLDKNVKGKTTTDYYRKGIELVYQKGQKNAFNRGIPFIWCSNNLTASFAIQTYLYKQLSADTKYDALAQANFDWLFGCNPWGTSMVYGLPSWGDTPTDPHSAFTHIGKFPIDGGMVDGPVYG
ncbi:MAG: hypothetical protein EOP54_30440, partial [Sphingobacteriales bacterium]